ncbi:hypothetical protein KL930_005377 [Ogataea haglerorum]|uniref:DUF7907 domain-containing protein n=1 Tax=Ogataea haglerorum TaxID=1937702 RepID=A0AAN6D1U5_9ASCO|nr:uncharacterized protein KL911_002305 [Ogataea haglerorum]KAG7696421.1 hypothetical protein KL915_002785 [Ogataea haglerorum]KAG7706764.1 hypothetical protein KL914_002648 [Ogataea haglerorum]KAG7708930.1 hypothetical protein KL950_002450 [Ogataea haglerorum]KAG7716425.1 hypothetical protein KL913_003636 [Ogataea haglerorum]KAG7716874.1 hypothetical protein KL949_003470 [Ogataea haglerorum]
MRFSSTLALATTVASVLAQDVSLYVDSPDTELDGNGLQPLHEGAALNYLFLSNDSSYTWNYNADTKQLTAKLAQYDLPVSLKTAPYVSWGAATGYESFTFASDGTLQVNGSSDGFYACKNTNDPYGYSENGYELMYYTNEGDVPSDSCTAISLTSTKPQSAISSAEKLPLSTASASVTSVTSMVTAASTQTHTVCPGNCSSSAISTFENNARVIAPAGAAVLGGMAVLFL